jgi:prepilin-type N-terminal cleavage/methylation domain-containing protein
MKIRTTNDQARKSRNSGGVLSFEFRRSNFRGAFTLIELILVLTLLVIITSIAVPTMSRFVRGRALGAESQRLLALMHATQSRAVSEGAPMMLWIDEKTGAYGMEAETSGQNGDAKAEELNVDATLKIAVVNVGTGAQTTFKDFPAIKFLPDGTVDEGSPQGLLLMDGDGFARELTMNKARTGYEIGDAKK